MWVDVDAAEDLQRINSYQNLINSIIVYVHYTIAMKTSYIFVLIFITLNLACLSNRIEYSQSSNIKVVENQIIANDNRTVKSPLVRFVYYDNVTDPNIYVKPVLSVPIIEQLSRMPEIELSEIVIDNPDNRDETGIRLYYDILDVYSKYGFIYRDCLYFAVLKDGSVQSRKIPLGHPIPANSFDFIDSIKNKIIKFESDTRIQEFVQKMPVNKQNPVDLSDFRIVLTSNGKLFEETGEILYVWGEGVTSYVLPFSLEWHQFPEIKSGLEFLKKESYIYDSPMGGEGLEGSDLYSKAHFNTKPGDWRLMVPVIRNETHYFVQLIVHTDKSIELVYVEKQRR